MKSDQRVSPFGKSLENAESAAQAATGKFYQFLIGLGGGSAIDVTMMTSVLLKHGGDIRNYFGLDKIPGRGFPTILIPTTSGTGSEVSKFAIFEISVSRQTVFKYRRK